MRISLIREPSITYKMSKMAILTKGQVQVPNFHMSIFCLAMAKSSIFSHRAGDTTS